MNEKLSPLQRALLLELSEDGGLTTGSLLDHVGEAHRMGNNRHQASGAMRSWLMELKKRGLVRFLDDQKPVCWTRTAAGTLAVEAAPPTPKQSI